MFHCSAPGCEPRSCPLPRAHGEIWREAAGGAALAGGATTTTTQNQNSKKKEKVPKTHGETERASGRGAAQTKQTQTKPPFLARRGGGGLFTPPQNFLWQRHSRLRISLRSLPVQSAIRGAGQHRPQNTPMKSRGVGTGHGATARNCAVSRTHAPSRTDLPRKAPPLKFHS